MEVSKSIFVVAVVFLFCKVAIAETTALKKATTSDTKKASTSDSKNKVLKDSVVDFEADVVEGERQVPDIFLQSEVASPSLDAVLFKRKNFNDFHSLELKRKPVYISK